MYLLNNLGSRPIMAGSQNISFPLEEVAAHNKWLETKKKL